MDEQTLQKQTLDIVECFFDDDERGYLQTDSVDSDSFDPGPIAAKLREVAESLQNDIELREAFLHFQKEQLEMGISTAFGHAVESVCQIPVAAEVAPEMQMIKAAMALCLYVKRQAPELKAQIQQATSSFLNTRLGSFLAQQGGWRGVYF